MTKRTIVYRVTGIEPTLDKPDGVYRTGMASRAADLYNKWWRDIKDAEKETFFDYQGHCPSPRLDSKLDVSLLVVPLHNYFFGFESLSQYRSYFKSEKYRECLWDCGAFMTEYSVDNNDIRFGDHQLIFIRKHAKLVTFYPLPV